MCNRRHCMDPDCISCRESDEALALWDKAIEIMKDRGWDKETGGNGVVEESRECIPQKHDMRQCRERKEVMSDVEKKDSRFYMEERVRTGVHAADGSKMPLDKLAVDEEQTDLSAKALFTQLWSKNKLQGEVLKATAAEHGVQLED